MGTLILGKDEFLQVKDVAEQLGTTPRQVQKLVRQGRLPHVRNGRSIRFPRPTWEAFLSQQAQAALAGLRGTINEVCDGDV